MTALHITPTSMTLLCLHSNLIYKYTQVMEINGIEWARGWNVILLKVSVFNRVIFISFLRVNRFGLPRGRSERNAAQRGDNVESSW